MADLSKLGERVRYLTDRSAIRDCLNLLARGMDRLDDDILLGVFASDANIQVGAWVGDRGGFLARAHAVHSRVLMTSHHITTTWCDFKGDAADVEARVVSLKRLSDGHAMTGACERLVGRLERRDDGWRIVELHLDPEFAFNGESVWSAHYRYLNRDRRDPSYHGRELLPPDFEKQRADAVQRAPAPLKFADLFGAHIYVPKAAPGSAGELDELAREVDYLTDRQHISDCIAQSVRGGAAVTHVMTHNCDIAGDAAHAETYVLTLRPAPAGGQIEGREFRYVDRLERRGGEWKVAARKILAEPSIVLVAGKVEPWSANERPTQRQARQESARRNQSGTSDLASLRAEVLRLVSRQQIKDVPARYARGVDRKDPDTFVSIFHPDGVDMRRWDRVETATEFLNSLFTRQDKNVLSVHNMSTHTVEIDGDTAYSETYLFWLSTPSDEAIPVKVGSGRYIDWYERRGGEFRLTLRRFFLDVSTDAKRGGFEGVETGARSRADFSFQR